jgi:3-oxoacyl-[acyl-carrier-protein] synthase-3
VTNNDFIRAFGKRAAVVDRMIPHKSRYCGIDLSTGEALAWNSEMACAASMEALAMAGVEKDDVDMIILASASPDRLLPPGFTGIQRMLGIDECMGMDIRSGCSGFGAAMITAQLFIESFRARTVLVVGSELNSTRSSFLFKEGREKFPLHALFNLMLFGDGAGAVVLQAADAEDEGIFCSSMASTKPCAPSGSRIEVGGSMAPFPVDAIRKEDWIITQEPKLTSEMIPLVFCEAVQKFIHENGLSLDSFDTFVFPVDSPHILERVLEGLPGLDEQRIVSIGSEGGSMVNASIPVSLCRAFEEGRLGKGRRILIYAAENTQWQHAIIGLDGSF